MKKFLSIIILLSVLAPLPAWGALSLSDEIKNIYNTYSEYLDTQWTGAGWPARSADARAGWNYSVPSRHYQETNKNSSGNLRMQATLAMAYRFRADDESRQKIREAVFNVLGEKTPMVNRVKEKGKIVSTRSFHDMIGLYLALRLLEERQDIFKWDERSLIIKKIEQVFPWALSGLDNENRALLSAAYGLAVLRHPFVNFSAADQKKYARQIRDKIKIGRAAIDGSGVYRESSNKKYSLHYHLVSALMLSYLGQELPDKPAASLSKKMLAKVHNWFSIGKLSWAGSARPTGIGLQAVLLRAGGEKYLGNKNWKNYWDAEKKNRGFIDPANPQRLVWKDDVDKTLNDDYSFMNMAELLFLENN